MTTTPPRTSWRSLLLATALCTTAAASQWWPLTSARHQETSRATPALAQLLPVQFGNWQRDERAIIRPVSAAADVEADNTYVQTLEYVYVDTEQRHIMLSISRGSQQGDRLQAHRPEFCYRAQGFAITASHDTTLATVNGLLPLRRLATHRPGRSEPVSYWMTVGDEAALPGLTRKLAQLRHGLSGQIPDGLLVRISTIGEPGSHAYSLHDRFISDLLTALEPTARQTLTGRLES